MNANGNQGGNELVRLAKTWIQRDEQFPIDFNEIWELAGIQRRDNAQRHFASVIRNFNLVEGLEYSSFKRESTGGRPSTTWKMTIGAAKRFLASAQTKEGYKIIEALIQAEEELQAIKANPALLLGETLKPISEAITALSNAVMAINNRLDRIEQKEASPPSRRNEPKPVADVLTSSSALTRLRQHYITNYGGSNGLSAFHRALSTACQRYGYVSESTQGGLKIEPAAILDARVVKHIQDSQAEGFRQYEKRKGVKNRIQPVLGQMNFLNN